MNQSAYEILIGQYYALNLQKAMVFLRSMPFSNFLDPHKLILLASAAHYYLVEANTIMQRQGEEPKDIFFIESGQVMITKQLSFLPVEVYKDLTLEARKLLTDIDPSKLEFCHA
jgi:hypothetical protein